MEKDEIGFELALISKFVNKKKVCGQRKIFVINSFVNGRLIISTIKATPLGTLVRALNSFDY
jgi:hypothetical protein